MKNNNKKMNQIRSKKCDKNISRQFKNHEKKLPNCLMIILKLHQRINIDQYMERKWKYYLLNKCLIH